MVARNAPPPDSRWDAPPPPSGGKRVSSPLTIVADWTRQAWVLPEALWREVYYSYAGNHSRAVLEPGAPWWLGATHQHPPAAAAEVNAEDFVGQNTVVHCAPDHLARLLPLFEAAAARDETGTQLTVVVPKSVLDGGWAARLAYAGFGALYTCEAGSSVPAGRDGVLRRGAPESLVVLAAGRPRSCPRAEAFDREKLK